MVARDARPVDRLASVVAKHKGFILAGVSTERQSTAKSKMESARSTFIRGAFIKEKVSKAAMQLLANATEDNTNKAYDSSWRLDAFT